MLRKQERGGHRSRRERSCPPECQSDGRIVAGARSLQRRLERRVMLSVSTSPWPQARAMACRAMLMKRFARTVSSRFQIGTLNRPRHSALAPITAKVLSGHHGSVGVPARRDRCSTRGPPFPTGPAGRVERFTRFVFRRDQPTSAPRRRASRGTGGSCVWLPPLILFDFMRLPEGFHPIRSKRQ